MRRICVTFRCREKVMPDSERCPAHTAECLSQAGRWQMQLDPGRRGRKASRKLLAAGERIRRGGA